MKEWDLRYSSDSIAATLFKAVYMALIYRFFGDNGLGRDVIDHIMKETSLFNDYYANFDCILLSDGSAWFEGEEREQLFRDALEEELKVDAVPYGKTRDITIGHMLFGGQLLAFLGFDYGPLELPGGRETVPLGQIFRSGGRTTTSSPSYRLIADLNTSELHTSIAGGPTDRRFSRWYVSDMNDWINGNYKILK